MSLINARASFVRLVKKLADPGVPVAAEPDAPKAMPGYSLEWQDGEASHQAKTYAARHVRLIVRASDTFTAEVMVERMLAGLKLTNRGGLAVHPLYDYARVPNAPPQIGVFKLEQSGAIDVLQPSLADQAIREFALNLNVVYPRG